MHRRRMLMSLVASAMLSSAFADPGSAQETTRPLLSAQKLEQLINFALTNPRTFPVAEVMSRGLGLAHPFTTRNMRIEVADGRHSLGVGVSDPMRLIFGHRSGDTFYLFVTDRHARLLSAGRMVNSDFTPVAAEAARARFEAELRLWEGQTIPAE